jgi:signal transduction histidine kinase
VNVHASERARRLITRDLPIALVVAVLLDVGVDVALTNELSDQDDVVLPLPDWQGRLLLLAGALSLAFRRHAPVLVLVIAGTAALAYHALGFRPPPLPLAVLVALFTVAVVRRPLICGVAAGVYATALSVGSLTGATPMDDDQVYVHLVSVAATAMVGYGIALSRARARLAEQRTTELAREQDARTRRAVGQEQARIAREVHDIVAHDVSVMVAQAAAARRVCDREPRTAADALTSIETVGRDALDGLRRLMTLLRSEPGGSERSPQPDLSRLRGLLDQVERAGLPVELTICGEPRPLPATVELNAFRIIQEALTNTLKHAGPTRATVVVEYTADDLRLEIRDQGGTAEQVVLSPTSGYGLIGMQQRVSMLGGDIAAAAHPGQGFRVSARLPVEGVAG